MRAEQPFPSRSENRFPGNNRPGRIHIVAGADRRTGNLKVNRVEGVADKADFPKMKNRMSGRMSFPKFRKQSARESPSVFEQADPAFIRGKMTLQIRSGRIRFPRIILLLCNVCHQ